MAKTVIKTTTLSTGIMSPSQAVIEARARRDIRWDKREAEIRWFVDAVSEKIQMSMKKRVRLATEYLKDRIVRNISVPVVRGFRVKQDTLLDSETGKTSTRKRKETFVVERSVKGEFPRAETTQLMKTLFTDYREDSKGEASGYVGTPLDYGLILELRMDRSFLVRTLFEEADILRAILSGPIEGGSAGGGPGGGFDVGVS